MLGELAFINNQMVTSAAQVIQGADKIGFRIRRADLDARLKTAAPLTRACFYQPAVPLDPR